MNIIMKVKARKKQKQIIKKKKNLNKMLNKDNN